MKRMVFPVKNWNGDVEKPDVGEDSLSSLLGQCICDDDTTKKEQKPCDNNDMVSIRCRRHRRRINVPVTWLRTSQWLCPKCYWKLTPENRERYSPKRHDSSESGRRQVKKHFMSTKESRCGEIENKFQNLVRLEARKERQEIQNEDNDVLIQDKIRKIEKVEGTSCKGLSESFAPLMPRFRIKCKKCKKTVPCHKSWFDKSIVLCPECYCGMSDDEISQFHSSNPRSTAELFEIEEPKIYLTKEKKPDYGPIPCPNRWTSFGGGCTNEFIMSASQKELLRAVREGRLSKARAKIELNRRKNVSFFQQFPDESIRIVSL